MGSAPPAGRDHEVDVRIADAVLVAVGLVEPPEVSSQIHADVGDAPSRVAMVHPADDQESGGHEADIASATLPLFRLPERVCGLLGGRVCADGHLLRALPHAKVMREAGGRVGGSHVGVWPG